MHLVADDRQSIPVRVFGVDGSRWPVVIVHGLQSHSVWFGQFARDLADLGYAVYAFDRRGSGLSTAQRGDIGSYKRMIADIKTVSDAASEAS